jgi:phosphoglycerate dehydrogenase-like enzyme
MALLMLNNEIPRNVSNQRSAKWDQLFSDRIGGKTVIIIGVGNIGGGAAKWAKRFGLKVIGVRRTGKKHPYVDEMYRPQSLRKILPKADFVLVSAPHTKETHHLMGEKEIALM